MVQMGAKTTTITEADVAAGQQRDVTKTGLKDNEKLSRNGNRREPGQQQIIWRNVVLITLIHVLAVKSLYSYIGTTKYLTIIWGESLQKTEPV